jgi:hypothetical protein
MLGLLAVLITFAAPFCEWRRGRRLFVRLQEGGSNVIRASQMRLHRVGIFIYESTNSSGMKDFNDKNELVKISGCFVQGFDKYRVGSH